MISREPCVYKVIARHRSPERGIVCVFFAVLIDRAAHVRVVWECQLLSGGFRAYTRFFFARVINGRRDSRTQCSPLIHRIGADDGAEKSGRSASHRRAAALIHTFRFSRSGRRQREGPSISLSARVSLISSTRNGNGEKSGGYRHLPPAFPSPTERVTPNGPESLVDTCEPIRLCTRKLSLRLRANER